MEQNNFNNMNIQPTDIFMEGDQYVPQYMMEGCHVGGYRYGGQWNHFTNVPPSQAYPGPCSCGRTPCVCYGHNHGHSHNQHDHRPYKHTDIASNTDMRLYAGNLHQIQRLEKIVKERKSDKIIYVDLDGVISGSTVMSPFSQLGKVPQFFVKNAMSMLRFYGFKVYGITTELPGAGFDIDNQISIFSEFDKIISVPSNEKFMYIEKNHDITKVFYIGDDLYSMAMNAGKRSPITLCTTNAMYMVKNLAHYVSLSSAHDYSFFDFATSILRAFGINAMSYTSKTRRVISVDLANNKKYNIGSNVAFTENSNMWVNTYLPLLQSVYNVNPDDISMAISYVTTNNFTSLDDIYVTTDLDYFIKNFNLLKNNRVYILLDPLKIKVDNLIFREQLKSLNSLYFVGLEWSLLTQHIGALEQQQLYKYCTDNNLYNLLSVMDSIFPFIEGETI